MKNRRKSQSLKSQLLLRWIMLLTILLIGLGIYQYNSMKRYLYNSRVEFLDSRFKNLEKKAIVGTNTEELLLQNKNYFLEEVAGEDICVVIINNKGEKIGVKNIYNGIYTDTSKEIHPQFMAIPTLSKEKYIEIIQSEGLAAGYRILKDSDNKEQLVIWRQIGEIGSPTGVIQISTYIEPIKNMVIDQSKIYVLSAFFILVLGIILGNEILKHTLKPLKDMTKAVEDIDTNQLNFRISSSGQLEVDNLTRKFNAMLEKLEKAFNNERSTNEKMKNFVLNASHELRTPLTSIQGFIEILQLGAAKNEEQLDLALSSMMTETKRLSKLVNNLLLLTRLEDKTIYKTELQDINSIIRELLPQLKILGGDRTFELDLTKDIIASVNKDQIKQVLYNLVQNAVNYTEEVDGKIIITTKEFEKDKMKYAIVSVSDNGEGIGEEDQKKIFDKFFRVDKHRSRRKGGYGLGLSIVKSIIDNHNGHIEVISALGKGTTFVIYLPETINNII